MFRITSRIIYGIPDMGSRTIIVGCRHLPAVLDAKLVAIEENPWCKIQEWEVRSPTDLPVLHSRSVYHTEEEYDS